jgi:hypothetical protein
MTMRKREPRKRPFIRARATVGVSDRITLDAIVDHDCAPAFRAAIG